MKYDLSTYESLYFCKDISQLLKNLCAFKHDTVKIENKQKNIALCQRMKCNCMTKH